jgi:hypothetical protein
MENKELGEMCVAMKLKTISWKMGAKSENVKRKYFYFEVEFEKTFVNLRWVNVTTHKKGIHRDTTILLLFIPFLFINPRRTTLPIHMVCTGFGHLSSLSIPIKGFPHYFW